MAFFSMNLKNWLLWNIQNAGHCDVGDIDWHTLFFYFMLVVMEKGGWVKLNTDGALPSYRPEASIGGVFRDADVNWLCGFSLWVGNDTIFKVEARVVLQGLQIAWENGYRKLELVERPIANRGS
ncbi:hypothetical protein Goklo_027818 [Gossypium klotzschianum]|uniref:RNase H type-1 domain-containing protein n=1 Tax=Gossypium klotzschianum TaxID=34286 RepID=A0A7J8TZ89_9ROSI|nr:hypothetical protein [Gossypium klotzschianum]